jgi:E3 ubiquitin-protein ligase RNF14
VCVQEGLINQVACIHTRCSASVTKALMPKTKEDRAISPCTFFSFLAKLDMNAFGLLPSTLSQIFGDNQHLVSRYIRLIKQKFYEKATGTIYCPRESCHAPAMPKDPELQVIVCPRCQYPFCKFCRASWHGSGAGCKISEGYFHCNLTDDSVVEKYLSSNDETKRQWETMYGAKVLQKLVENWENDQASVKYLQDNTVLLSIIRLIQTSCPKCNTHIQKSSGCNKMICRTCLTKFCYLCGE